jgi:AcrR family transcriptional regulator
LLVKLKRNNYCRISKPAMEEAKKESRRAGRPRSERARRDILEAAYKLLKAKGFHAVGSHEIASAAGVSSATVYRWWDSKEEILLHACFEHMKPVLAVSGSGSALERLRRYVLYVAEFLASDDGAVMARLVTGIHDDTKLQRMFLELCDAKASDATPLYPGSHRVGRIEAGNRPGTADRRSEWAAVLSLAAGARSFREELFRTHL